MKICNKCKIEKKYILFNKKSSSYDRYDNICKDCKKIMNKEYYSKNTKTKIQYATNYYKSNQMYDKLKEYYVKHHKQYYIENKDKILEYNNRYHYISYNNISEFKIKKTLRTRFHHVVKGYKIKSILNILGCTLEYFQHHISQQFKLEMTWENHGKIWEIDHIIPCDSFDLTDIEQQKQCFHYSNMQPLFKTTEIAKSFGYINEIGNRNKSNKYE
jgi:hypothetical protein